MLSSRLRLAINRQAILHRSSSLLRFVSERRTSQTKQKKVRKENVQGNQNLPEKLKPAWNSKEEKKKKSSYQLLQRENPFMKIFF